MVRPAEAPRRPVEGTPIQFETIRRDYSPPVTRARNRLRSQRTRVSTQPVTEVIRNRAVSRQIYHNMHIVRTPNNIEHNSMVLRSHVAHMDQQDAMRQTLPTDGTQPRRKAKPRGIFTNAQKRRAQQSQCPVGSFNDRNLHLRPSLLNLAQGPQPGPSTVPARDERRNAHTMVTRTQSGGYWRPDLSAHSSSSSIDDTTTGTQNTAKRQGAASQQKDGNMLTSNIKTEVRTLAEKRRAMLARKMNASKSSGCSSKDSEKEGSTSLPLERDTPSHSSHSRSDQSSEGTPSHSSSDQSSEGTPSHSSHSSRDQSSVVTTHTSSESDIDFSVLHRPSDLSLSELPEHGPVRGKPNTSRWFKSLGKGPRPWSSSSESTNEGKASSEESFRSISTVASNSSHKSNDLNLPFDNANNHSLSISKTEENNTDKEESTSGVQTECRDTMVGDKSNTDLQTGSQGPALNDTNARLQTGNNSIVASSTVAGGNNQDMRAPVINQNTQATDAASFVRSQSMKRKYFEDMLVHDTRNETKKKKIDIKWKRPPPYFQHLNKELAPKNRSEISSDGREDKSVDNIRAGIYGDMRKKDDKNRKNTAENNTAKDGDTTDNMNAEVRENNTAKNSDTWTEEYAAKSRANIFENNTVIERNMRNEINAASSDDRWVNNTAIDEVKDVMKSRSDEGWVYINLDNSITIHESSREKSVGDVIQEMLNQSRIKAFANWKDAKNRNRTRANNKAKEGIMRDKEEAKSRDTLSVNNAANRDIRNDVNAGSRENILANNSAKYGDLRHKEDANVFVNNTAIDEDKHVMKSKSDEGWVYINLDNSITIHESSREKSVGDVIQEMLNQSRIKAFANWKDAKNRNRTRAYNTAKGGIMRDKEEAESRDNFSVSNTANGDIRNDVNAEIREHMWVNNTAKYGELRDNEDALSTDNILVNNTSMDEDKHVMKSKSDLGWKYINLDKRITIHESSREKSVGEVIQEMLNQSRIKAFANWKDAKDRNRTRAYNTAKDEIMRDKEEIECRDNVKVNNTANGDIRNDVNAESRDNIRINSTAQNEATKEKDDAEISNNIFVNNTAMDEDNHAMKSKSDEGWVYINLDNSITIHESSREKSVGEVIQEMLNQSRIKAFANWKDARNRNRTWVYNTAKDGNTRDKENTEDPDNLLVNDTADRDMKIEVNAERRDNIWINNTAKYGDMRKKEDATSSDNTFENNTALGEDKHIMKSKSDEGWVYINLDKSIVIHTSSPEKSVGEVIQEMLNQSRMNRLPNREASVPSYSLESQSRKRKLDFNISSQTKKKKMDIKWEQPQTNIQHSAMELTAVESRIHVDLPSTSTMIYPEQVAKEVEEGIDMAPSKTGMTYNTRSAVKRKRGFEKDVGEGKDWDGKRRRC